MREDDKLTQIEADNIIDKSINLSILSKLLRVNLIDEKQFNILRKKIEEFY